jgi:hypothetical protein
MAPHASRRIESPVAPERARDTTDAQIQAVTKIIGIRTAASKTGD